MNLLQIIKEETRKGLLEQMIREAVKKQLKETYYGTEEAYEAENIPWKTAKREIEKHGLPWEEFVRDVGLKNEYSGEEVLSWMGY